MFHLISAEWLKLIRRPLTWVLFWIFLGLLLLQFVTQAGFVLLIGQRGGMLGAQIEEYARRSVLPGAWGMGLAHLNGLGGIFAIILAGGAMGSEYSWGTLRTSLARSPNRLMFLLAKIMTIMLLLLLAGVITVLVSGGLGLLVGLATGQGPGLGPEVLLIPLGLLRAVYVLLPYVLLTISLTIMGRSLLVGIAGGLVYLVAEAGYGALAVFAQLGGIWRQIFQLTIGQNINTLVMLNGFDYGLRPDLVAGFSFESLPSPLQATLAIAVYSLSFFATAAWLLQNRDIGGAG